jgi:phosphoglycerate dehydrogenase-like enzyme
MQGPILVTRPVESRYGSLLERAAPGVSRIVLGSEGAASQLEAVDVVYFSGDLYPDEMGPFLRALKQIRSPRWLHSFSAGVDNVFFLRLLERGVRVTTSSGAHAVPIAQTVILYLLALSRDLPGWLGEQQQRVWKPRSIGDLQGRVLGVVGLGPIGLEVARLGSALRMRVVGVRRRPRGDEPCETWEFSELPKLLALADCLVLALPLTDDTRHLIDASALAAMKRSALLVNVGRGELVDEAALTTALQTGSLGGAGLDVFEVEPLPPSSPLWELPNVIITPHSSGSHSGNLHRASEIFIENLRHYVRGEPLQNEVPRPAS